MKKIYCISGLGADERVFQNLHVPGVNFEYIKWLVPRKGESIEDYATRMNASVEGDHPVLMGVSFGGMMSIEMAKQKPVQKIIIISSVKSHEELPPWMKITGKLHLNALIPERSPQWFSQFADFFLGAENEQEKILAKHFRNNVSSDYLHWAIDKVIKWQNTQQPGPIFHIHGTLDKTFPIRNIQPTHVIKNGGHFMVMNKADEISAIIEGII